MEKFDSQPVDVFQNHVVPQILLWRPVMEVLSGKPQIKLEPGHESLYSLLRVKKSLDIFLFQTGAFFANEYVVNVHQDHPIEVQAQLTVGQIWQGVQQK